MVCENVKWLNGSVEQPSFPIYAPRIHYCLAALLLHHRHTVSALTLTHSLIDTHTYNQNTFSLVNLYTVDYHIQPSPYTSILFLAESSRCSLLMHNPFDCIQCYDTTQ